MSDWPTPTELTLARETIVAYDFGPPPEPSQGDIVLLHGMADVARSLEPLAIPLAHRHRVVTFDARGHGRSSHPGAYSMLHFVADLVGLIEELALERPILIGHSLGGHTVANYAGLYPDRVRAVVLLEGMGPPSPARPASVAAAHAHGRAMVEVLRGRSRHRPQPDLAAAAERLCAVHGRLSHDRAMQLAEEGTRSTPDGGRIWCHDERTWHWVASIDHAVNEQRWAAITVPVLAVSGAEAWDTWWARPGGPGEIRERLSDEAFDARLALFGDVEHVELAEAGHMLHFDRPERVNELIADFLSRRVESV